MSRLNFFSNFVPVDLDEGDMHIVHHRFSPWYLEKLEAIPQDEPFAVDGREGQYVIHRLVHLKSHPGETRSEEVLVVVQRVLDPVVQGRPDLEDHPAAVWLPNANDEGECVPVFGQDAESCDFVLLGVMSRTRAMLLSLVLGAPFEDLPSPGAMLGSLTDYLLDKATLRERVQTGMMYGMPTVVCYDEDEDDDYEEDDAQI